MSEPLQLISFAEAVWQMYVTSFPRPFCAEFYPNSNVHEYLILIAFCSYQSTLIRPIYPAHKLKRSVSFLWPSCHYGLVLKILDRKHWRPNQKKVPKSSLSGGVHCTAVDGFFLIVTLHSLAIWWPLLWISFTSHQQWVLPYFLSLSKRTPLNTITLQRCVWTLVGWSD